MKTETYNIGGMTCAACSRAVERVTKKLDGVESSSVNLTTEKLSITYDDNITSEIDIIKRIEKAGYTAKKEIKEKVKEEKDNGVENLRKRLIVSSIFTVPLLLYAMLPMMNVHFPKAISMHDSPITFSVIQLILVIPVIYMGLPFFKKGFKTLFSGNPNMDSLIAMGSSAAFIYSIYSIIHIIEGDHSYAHALYFESTAVILTLITLGKYFESISKKKTFNALKTLIDLVPKKTIVLRDDKEISLNIEEVKLKDIILIKPGERLSVDGKIIEGETTIDESMITGESIPVYKKVNDEVIGGSINKDGFIKYKATKIGGDTTISKIVKLVEEAQGSKAPISKLADIISGYFVPIVIALAIISGIFWFVATKDFRFSLKIFIAVLVIACPCALGLATPTAIMVGTGKGAENGVLIKSGEALEIMHKIDTIVLDKTGTITEGRPKVVDIITYNFDKNTLVSMAASIEKMSQHPLGEAIAHYGEKRNLEILEVSEFKNITGSGVLGNIDGKVIATGNKRLMDTLNIDVSIAEKDEEKFSKVGKTPMYVVIDGELKGIIAVFDTVKENSKNAIKAMKAKGIEIVMITGDNKKVAQVVGDELNLDKILAEVLPEDKAFEVEKLQKTGKKVMMVGDGINDAVALAKADIGMAIGAGTDVAIESCDVVLMKSDLSDILTAIELSRKTIINIKQNLFWAFLYNIIGIPFAMGIVYLFNGILLNPMIAALAMSLSSVSVVLNALRLRSFKKIII